jgi:hypothetical protein
VTAEEFGALIGRSPRTVYRLARQLKLKRVYLGTSRKAAGFLRSDVGRVERILGGR